MGTIRLKAVCIAAVILTFLALGAPAQADPMLDFGIIAPTTGSISYAGGSTPLVGTTISVDNVVGLGTPTNSGTPYTILNGSLSFSTGNYSGGGTATWDFSGGGTITLTGCVDVSGAVGVCDATDINASNPTGVLFSGTFLSAQVFPIAGTFKIAGAGFVDLKDPNLVAFFGLPTNVLYLGAFNISFNTSGTPPNGFTSSSILSGDISNQPLPEPTSMILLGTGLLSTAFATRRRMRRASRT